MRTRNEKFRKTKIEWADLDGLKNQTKCIFQNYKMLTSTQLNSLQFNSICENHNINKPNILKYIIAHNMHKVMGK